MAVVSKITTATMIFAMVVVAVQVLLASAITKSDCPTGIPRNEYLQVFQDRCYGFQINEKKTFGDAQLYCQQDGGNLAIVKSKEINEFIKNKLNNVYDEYGSFVWIGLHYVNNELVWVDGSSVTYKNFQDTPLTSTDGAIALLSRSGAWEEVFNDFGNGEEKNRFICDYSPVPPPTTNSTTQISLDDCPSDLVRDQYLQVHGNKCYRFSIDVWVPFQDAQNYCKKYDGDLVLVKSKDINDFISDELKSTYGKPYTNVWIGLQKVSETGRFEWVDGTSLKYENFGPHEASYGKKYIYVSMGASSGTWYTDKATSKSYFVCEF